MTPKELQYTCLQQEKATYNIKSSHQYNACIRRLKIGKPTKYEWHMTLSNIVT
jgi:hypothetical protein